jgi:hypothetical protein
VEEWSGCSTKMCGRRYKGLRENLAGHSGDTTLWGKRNR